VSFLVLELLGLIRVTTGGYGAGSIYRIRELWLTLLANRVKNEKTPEGEGGGG